MNYHFKNKFSNKWKNRKIIALVIVLILLFLILGIFGGESAKLTNKISNPFVNAGHSIRQVFYDLFSFVDIRSNLVVENDRYKSDLFRLKLQLDEYNLLTEENKKLKKMLRISENYKETYFANILMSPPTTPNDILIIDIGSDKKIKRGNFIAIGKTAIGIISEVFQNTSKIKMFSTNDVETTGKIKDSAVTVKGNGGGNFKVDVPKDLEIQINDKFLMKNDYGTFIVGEVKNIEIKQSTYFKEILLTIPINILEAQMVQIFQ